MKRRKDQRRNKHGAPPRDRGRTADGPDHAATTPPEAHEKEVIEERQHLRSPVVFEIVREEGEDELARPPASLWWSGVTAGVAVSMALVAEGLLYRHLPDAPWRALVVDLGYPVGFLIVVLGRLQLFTENTVTVVLPVMATPTRHNLWLALRLWGIVLAGNLAGTLLFAVAARWGHIFAPEQVAAFLELARQGMDRSALDMALRGIPAGFLIAAMVWMLPSARGGEFWVILVISYLVALGGFTHVVVGASGAFLLLVQGELAFVDLLFRFLVPAFVGNVIGGTALFAALAHGQVRKEL